MGKRLSEERSALILQRLREGKTAGAVARELGANFNSIKRLAREHGVTPRSRSVAISSEVQASVTKLVEGSRVTLGEIASSFGIRRSTLKRRLHAAGVRGHGRHLRPAERRRIDALLEAGHKVPAIARQIGRHKRTVERYCAARRAASAPPPLAAAS